MDGQNYLNQISATVRPEKKSKMNFLKSPIFIVIVIGIVGVIGAMIIGSALGDNKEGVKAHSISLKFHIDNTMEVINTYQPNVKSSDLRSSSASLQSVLSNTSRDLTNYLVNTYAYKDGDKNNQILADEAKLEQDGLLNDLFEAKITGVLDRVYAVKMAYEISLLTSEESRLFGESSDQGLRDILVTSYDSLNNLYSKFNDFSGTK